MNPHPEIPTPSEPATPTWIRLPKPGGRCRYSSLSRTSLNQLLIPGAANHGKPPVKSCIIKKPGAIRGIRLISYPSLMTFLDSQQEGGA